MGVTFRKSGNLGVILIENSAKYNAMNLAMFGELDKALTKCEKDKGISAIILTGQGQNFCAGFDVSELYELVVSGDRKAADLRIREIQTVAERLASCSKPTIAVIDGFCLGGGLELALACKVRLASQDAKFGFPEIDLSVIPGLGGTQRLPRLIGASQALGILIGGNAKKVSAHRAFELGIVDKVLIPEGSNTFIGMAKDYAEEICAGSQQQKLIPDSVCLNLKDEDLKQIRALGKNKSVYAVNALLTAILGVGLPLEAGLALEHEVFIDVLFTDEAALRMRKFLRISDPVADISQEHTMLRQGVREFVRKEILPRVSSMEENGEIPRDLIQKMAEFGFFGTTFPKLYGGQGMTAHAAHIIAEEIARAHASCAVFYGAHTALACGAIDIAGNEAQKQKYLVPAIRGEKIGAFALTDESGGSDVAGMKTSARKDGDCWILKGSKHFITNGTIADFVVVFAQTGSPGDNKTISAFIVDKDTPGFGRQSVGKKVGLHASDTATLDFSNARIPEENLLGEVGQGFKIAMMALNRSRLGLCAVALGEAKEAFDLAAEYSVFRQVEGRSLYEKQMIQERLGEMSISVFAIESALRFATVKVEAGEDARREIAEAKVFCTFQAMKVIDTAFQIFGGSGYMHDTVISRMLRDARVNTIFDGTNEINTLLAAKEALKNVLLLGRGASERV